MSMTRQAQKEANRFGEVGVTNTHSNALLKERNRTKHKTAMRQGNAYLKETYPIEDNPQMNRAKRRSMIVG